MNRLDDDLALRPSDDRPGRWEGAIAPGWHTPRGPLGGYVMAILIRGLELAVDDPQRTARSVTVHFLRPPSDGPVGVSAVAERAGRSLTTVSGRLEQDGKPIALALGAYSKPWEGPLLCDAPMPEVEPPAEDDRAAAIEPPDRAPAFVSRLAIVPRFGDPPFSGSEHGEAGGWLGLRERRPLDASAIALLADAWMPAPWSMLSELAPAPTIDLTVHFRTPLPLADSLLLGRFRTTLVRDRVLRGGRPAVGTRRHPGRPVAAARPTARSQGPGPRARMTTVRPRKPPRSDNFQARGRTLAGW